MSFIRRVQAFGRMQRGHESAHEWKLNFDRIVKRGVAFNQKYPSPSLHTAEDTLLTSLRLDAIDARIERLQLMRDEVASQHHSIETK